jgi:hypothetical protein
MAKRLNILELHRTINEKNDRKMECYEKVLEMCHRKIQIGAENKQLRCLFEVPEYIYGYPIYDLNNCIKYVIKSLQTNGFLAHYYFPKYIYVSWDFEEMKPNDVVVPAVTPGSLTTLTSSLLARPEAAASLKKKNTGKLELNLY